MMRHGMKFSLMVNVGLAEPDLYLGTKPTNRWVSHWRLRPYDHPTPADSHPMLPAFCTTSCVGRSECHERCLDDAPPSAAEIVSDGMSAPIANDAHAKSRMSSKANDFMGVTFGGDGEQEITAAVGTLTHKIGDTIVERRENVVAMKMSGGAEE